MTELLSSVLLHFWPLPISICNVWWLSDWHLTSCREYPLSFCWWPNEPLAHCCDQTPAKEWFGRRDIRLSPQCPAHCIRESRVVGAARSWTVGPTHSHRDASGSRAMGMLTLIWAAAFIHSGPAATGRAPPMFRACFSSLNLSENTSVDISSDPESSHTDTED